MSQGEIFQFKGSFRRTIASPEFKLAAILPMFDVVGCKKQDAIDVYQVTWI
jgi:hypothetical protein